MESKIIKVTAEARTNNYVQIEIENNLGEKEVLNVVHYNEGNVVSLDDTKADHYTLVADANGNIAFPRSLIEKTQGVLKGLQFIIGDDGICLSHDKDYVKENIYQGYDSEKGSKYMFGDFIVYIKSEYENRYFDKLTALVEKIK